MLCEIIFIHSNGRTDKRKDMIKQNLTFKTAYKTHNGMVRSNNEDSLFVIDQQLSDRSEYNSFGLYIIADGMGGHQGGEIASKIATQVVSTVILDNLLYASDFQDPFYLVKEAIKEANKKIYKMTINRRELRSMGTTITVGLRLDNELYVGHVGDSRAYLIREGGIKQLTSDHSLIAHLLKEGTITPVEARTHPDRGVILRCLGMSEEVDVDSYYQEGKLAKLLLKKDDSLVFCSDGLTNYVKDEELFEYVRTYRKSDEVCKRLIDLANSRGGADNISVIVVKV